jgi:hypothetical protein
VVDLVARALPARHGFALGEVQVLTPMHRGEAGAGALNTLLQERLNPARDGLPEARAGRGGYRPDNRVLQLKKDCDLGVFNGDLGTVRAVDLIEQEVLLVLDDGREVQLSVRQPVRPDPRLRRDSAQNARLGVPCGGHPAVDEPRADAGADSSSGADHDLRVAGCGRPKRKCVTLPASLCIGRSLRELQVKSARRMRRRACFE